MYFRDFYVNYFPGNVRRWVRKARHGSFVPQEYRDLNCVYVHVPKTGGSSVSKAIFGARKFTHDHFTYLDFYFDQYQNLLLH